MIIGKAISPFSIKRKSSGAANDADAQAFITASGISGTEATAINQLVIDLKAANIWTKMKAAYPFVGNTASSQKWNLKDARDLDAAYRLVFSGGVTFSSNGMLGGGVNGYANTFLNPATIFPSGFASIGIYNKVPVTNLGTYIGSTVGTTNFFRIAPAGATTMRHFNKGAAAAQTNNTILTELGFHANSRTSNTLMTSIDNAGTFQTNTTTVSISYSSFNIPLLASSSSGTIGSYSNAQLAFAYISDALISTELTSLKSIVQTFNTTLGRQV